MGALSLFSVMFVVILSLTSSLIDGGKVTLSGQSGNSINQCESLAPNCECLGTTLVNVNCAGLEELDDVIKTLKDLFWNVTINHVDIHRSSFKSIPSNAFSDLHLRQIFLQNNNQLEEVSDQAFANITGLYTLKFKSNNFTEIPDAVSKLSLSVFELANNSLIILGTELQGMTSLQMLLLYNNSMVDIHPEAFEYLYNLKSLQLETNRLTSLDPRLFKNTKQLVELNLRGNSLKTLDGILDPAGYSLKTLFLGDNNLTSIDNLFTTRASSLDALYLAGNQITSISSGTFSWKYPVLALLDLDSNLLNEIASDAFHQLNRLQYLSLRSNNISFLSSSTFQNLYALEKIYLSSNRLTSILGVFRGLNILLYLYIAGNHIQDISGELNDLSLVRELVLTSNRLTILRNGTFSNCKSMQRLMILHNKIEVLEPGAFQGLGRLTSLALSSNRIKSLGLSMTVRSLRNLLILWLDNNLLTRVENDDLSGLAYVKEIGLTNNHLVSVEGAFSHLHYLQDVRLNENFLKTVTGESFSDKVNLKVLNMRNNDLVCDCRFSWLIEAVQSFRINLDRRTACHSPPWLYQRKLDDLTVENLTRWLDDCPTPCECTCHPNGTKIYTEVQCQNRNLTSFPETFPSITAILDISGNHIHEVPANLSRILPSLQSLSAEGNMLRSLGGSRAMAHQLRGLYLARNEFVGFTLDGLYNSSLVNVTLSGNPWACDCQAKSFHSWLLQHEAVVIDVNQTTCGDGQLYGRRIVGLTELELCPIQLALYAIIVIAVLSVLFVCSSVAIGYIRYRMPIRVWLYSKGICSCLRCIKEEDIDEDKDFDVFVACSNSDWEVVEKLVYKIESTPPHYRVCYHTRDFEPGVQILVNIENAVKSSKKVLAVLSRNFLESQWSLTEFQIAYQQMMEEKINRIILVVVEDEVLKDQRLKEESSKDGLVNHLADYIKFTTYLSWKDKYFWEKLYYSLPRRSVLNGKPFVSREDTSIQAGHTEPLIDCVGNDSSLSITTMDDEPLISV